MSVQQVWFAQSSHSNTNSNDENLTCTSVHDSNLRQNMQGLNQNIIHYVDALDFYNLTTSAHTHTQVPFFQTVIMLISIHISLRYAVSWLAGPCSVPAASRVLPHTCVFHWWFLVFSLPPGGWRAAAQSIKKQAWASFKCNGCFYGVTHSTQFIRTC